MCATEVLRIRKDELTRRVEAMPREVLAWRQAAEQQIDLQLHFSQLKAIKTLTDAMAASQRALLAGLDPDGAPADFQRAGLAILKEIVRAQTAWDFFRDKLDLRRSSFQQALWVADTIAWDCHRPVLDEAALAGAIDSDQFREPPLVYLGAGYSPLTWVRRSRPNDGRRYDLGEATLPIPVIELPWDHVDNPWELMSLHHEVGHDIEADLALRAPLREQLANGLQAAAVPARRISAWLGWQGEVFADLCALQLGGPDFAQALMHLLLLPPDAVLTIDDDDPHPTPYLRVLLNAAYIRTLAPGLAALETRADQLAADWQSLYGRQPDFDAWLADLPLVFSALMDSPLPALAGRSVRSLMPFGPADEQRLQDAAGYFASGQNKPVGLRPRHCVAAARRAVSRLAAGGTVAPADYDALQARLARIVREGAPAGLRGSQGDAHDRFIARYASEVFAP